MASMGKKPVDDDDLDEFEDDDAGDDLGDDPGMRLLLPVGRSLWAIASGYLGLLSVLCLPAPFALFTGLMAVREIRQNPKKHGMGRAVFGIIMGGIGTLLLCLFLVLAAVGALK
jgi:hypothetical protein